MAALEHDLILVGGGLASSLIAWRLALDRPQLRVTVVERDGRLGGEHTHLAPSNPGRASVSSSVR